ncbi:hypothetical protein [Microlunatus flavus]|uniref:hypothetical protein n=1 Tax=Microlunatus flavus TaxID=1036181 RepID=UPI001113D4D9|nr:hypothetical protein [Microlunatus flavus]
MYGPSGQGYPPRTEELDGFDDEEQRDLLFKELSGALEAVDHPLEAAVDDLTVDDIIGALQALPMRRRADVLRSLGLSLNPPKVGRSLAQDVLARIRRAGGHDRRHACATLTSPLGGPVLGAAYMVGTSEGDALEKRLTAWSPALLRLSVWANGACSPSGARVWAWATAQPWFASPRLDPASIERVAAAASALIAATPELEFGSGTSDAEQDAAGSETEAGEVGENPDQKSLTDDAAIRRAGTEGPRDAANAPAAPEVSSTKPLADTPDASGANGAEAAPGARDLGRDLDELVELVSAAERAAHDAAHNLAGGRGPSPEHLGALFNCAAGFEALESAFSAAGVEVGDASVDGFRAALEDHRRQSNDLPLRESLARYAQLSAPAEQDELRSQLGRAAAHAKALLDLHTWSAAERATAQALALIVDLTAADLPVLEMLDIQKRAVAADTSLALLVIQASSLRATAPTPDAPDAEVGAEDADQTAAPTTVEAVEETALAARAGRGDTTAAPVPPKDIVAEVTATHVGHFSTEQPTAPSDAVTPPAVPNGTFEDQAAQSQPVGSAAPQEQEQEEEHSDGLRRGSFAEHPALAQIPVTQAAADAADLDEDYLDESGFDPADEALADLIFDGRYALAAELAGSVGTAEPAPAVLTTSALAAAVRTPNGRVAMAIKDQLADLETATLTDTASLLLIVPALLRVALVTGDYTAGARLLDAEPHLEQHLATLAREVGKRAVEGALVQSPPLTWVADPTSSGRAINEAAAEASDQVRVRKLRYKRASDIANDWLSADGFIGRALRVVSSDSRAKLDIVAEALTVLGDASAVTRQIEADDRRLRSGSSKAMDGPAVGNLMSVAAEAIGPLSRWAAAVEAGQRGDRRTSWSTAEVAAMRAAVQAAAPQAIEALGHVVPGTSPVVAAAAAAAAASLGETLSLLDGGAGRDAFELSVSNVLGLDLLHVVGVVVDESTGAISVPADVEPGDLAAAATRSWEDAVRLHIDGENFAAARRLVQASQSQLLSGPGGAPALSDEVVDLVSVSAHSAAADVEQTLNDLAAALREARLNNQISEEQDAELTARLDDARRDLKNPGAVRAILDSIKQRLPHYRQEAATRLRERLAATRMQPKVTDADVQRVAGYINRGDLGTAEELIYLLQTDETLPSLQPHDELQRFFPAVPEALPAGITTALVDAARRRQVLASCPALDFSKLNANLAELNSGALKGWMKLGATPPNQRGRISEHELLLPALRVIGIELKKFDRLDSALVHRDRRFVDGRDVTLNGDAVVPAFGSNAGDRRRILLVWGQPSAETLMSYVDQDPAEGPLIVAYFGTMSVQVRKDLAVRSLRSAAPVVVLDDAALAYLAAQGGRLFQSTMRILLPFANVNPYVRQKRGLVAAEMFYGRGDERRQVLDKDGTQIIYGGRGLGKSALLHDAAAVFERSGPPGERVAIYMSLDALGIGTGTSSAFGAAVLWDSLLQHLVNREVVGEKKSARGARANPYDKVQAAVAAWLGEHSSRRLLILLDESDRFFEADAPTFLETKRIRELGSRTQDRAKVVFAGLHSVQRFTKVAGNSPFSHLAQRPTVIGPLKPQNALDLLTAPLSALGYTFEEPDLVNRVLANCSYQPFLLQMFGHRLVERMHQQRRVAPPGQSGVPYVITRGDIEAVDANDELREDISHAFRETLYLDPRYNVIANVMARHAHTFGLDARLSDAAMREECLAWWRRGFAKLDVEGFRAYLSEMVGLGVLARNSDGGGWRLRGPAVLKMVGPETEVETQLIGADNSPLDEYVALEMHTLMGDNVTRSPLTASQMDDLIGDHANQVRVVLGSTATAVGDAVAAIAAAADIGKRFTVVQVATRGAFDSALVGGSPGERRVVVSSLAGRDEEVCRAALQSALTRIPDRSGVTRSSVLVADTGQLKFWREVLAQEAEVPTLSTVSLRRYDLESLRVWALMATKFRGSGRVERLLDVTGGWPFLVERAATQAVSSVGEAKVMDRLEASLATPEGAAELVAAVGVGTDPAVSRVYDDLVEALADDPDGADLVDLEALASESDPDPKSAVACLLSLGVLNASGSSARYRLEPVLAAAWQRR